MIVCCDRFFVIVFCYIYICSSSQGRSKNRQAVPVRGCKFGMAYKHTYIQVRGMTPRGKCLGPKWPARREPWQRFSRKSGICIPGHVRKLPTSYGQSRAARNRAWGCDMARWEPRQQKPPGSTTESSSTSKCTINPNHI